MRLRSVSSPSPDCPDGRGVRGRLQKFFRGNRSPTDCTNTRSSTDGPQPAAEEEPEVLFTFKDHLDLQQFSEANQLLIDQENQLFLNSAEAQLLHDWDEDVDRLHGQRQQLEMAILKTFRLSLNRGEVTPQVLTSAVNAMCKENDQDAFWMQQTQAPKPKWRPAKLREKHDRELKALVEDRMDNPTALCSSPEAEKGSSIKNDVWSMGRQLKQDLATVIELLADCYPKETDICGFYALLFHHVFGARLRKIAEFGLDDRDCTFILRWVNEFYPEILKKPNLSQHIDVESFGKLLPPSLLQPLEEQYLSRQQADMTTYIDKVLQEAAQTWISGNMPQMEDGCFVSETSFDIIQFVKGAVTTAEKVLVDRSKAQSLTSDLHDLLLRYKAFLEDVMKANKANSGPTVKANLHGIHQFSDVLVNNSRLFPADVRAACLVTLREMQRSAQTFLLSPIHAELKPLYKKLSSDWLKGAHFKNLLENIESRSHDLQGLTAASHQELIGQFHLDVAVEFVKRLIRSDKLKDHKKQQEAHDALKRDADSLHLLFTHLGSGQFWLKDVLVKIAEILRLQDLAALQMHVASMATSYPDFSERHVSAILKLKTNFSKTNRQIIKETLRLSLDQSTASTAGTSTSTSTSTTTAAAESTCVFFSLVAL